MNNSEIPVLHLDGVSYAILHNNSQNWLMGSIKSTWQEELARLGSQPDEQMLRQAAVNGIWLKKEQKNKPVALMCGGMGAAWPHMGRELYDNFPACREAMDFLAGQTDWDLLGLMDEPDIEIINQTRLQIPYLFMLEYAQWKQFTSLGLKPDLICGHSLGELFALCFAGVYSPASAWYLLNIRAAHIAELENRASKQEGMLAVSGDFGVIKDALIQNPDIKIANKNTPRQYVLGGSLDSLMRLRKILRRQRIPAFKLNMDIAFHNPAMRILRELSMRRLNALQMNAPDVPILSCVTADSYPDNKNDICKYIVDLDENAVDWPNCVNAMLEKYKIQTFLELGPQDILCNLTEENITIKNVPEKNINFITANRKGREKETMREACARLFANGYLDWHKIKNSKQINYTTNSANSNNNENNLINTGALVNSESLNSSPSVKIILKILAEASEFPVEQITPDLDLRHDLGLRSSRFPYLVQLAEDKLGKSFNLDKLLQIITVGDLINFLTDNLSPEFSLKKFTANADRKYYDFYFPAPPLERYKFENDRFIADPISPLKKALFNSDDIIAVCNFDEELQQDIVSGLSNFNIKIALLENDPVKRKIIEKTGTQILHLPANINTPVSDRSQNPDEIKNVLLDFINNHHSIHTLIFAFPCCNIENHDKKFLEKILPILNNLPINHKLFLQRFLNKKEDSIQSSFNYIKQTFDNISLSIQKTNNDALQTTRFIIFFDERKNKILENPDETGDLLAREIYCGEAQKILWTRFHQLTDSDIFPKENKITSKYNLTCPIFQKIFPEDFGLSKLGSGVFEASTQYSLFMPPGLNYNLKVHCQNAEFSPANWFEHEKPFKKSSWLPISAIFERILMASKILYPWLEPAGFSDIHFFSIPALPSGNTRECKITINSQPWLAYDDIMTHMCSFKMSLKKLEANGRASGHDDPLATGFILLCKPNIFLTEAKFLLKPIWEKPEDEFNNLNINKPVNQINLQNTKIKNNLNEFYKTLNIDDSHKFIKDCELNPITFNKEANIESLPPDSFFKLKNLNIAKPGNWEYKLNTEYKNVLLDACFQASLFRIAELINDDHDSESSFKNCNFAGLNDLKSISFILNCWRLHSIGYIRFIGMTNFIQYFNELNSNLEKINLWLRLSWKDSRIIRFDCQANIINDQPVLTIHHLEFERIDP